MIGADVLDKIKGISLSKEERDLLYAALVANGITILMVIGGIVALIVTKHDAVPLKDVATNLIWAELAILILFVAGNAEVRKKAVKAMTQKPPEPTA